MEQLELRPKPFSSLFFVPDVSNLPCRCFVAVEAHIVHGGTGGGRKKARRHRSWALCKDVALARVERGGAITVIVLPAPRIAHSSIRKAGRLASREVNAPL